MYNRKLFATKFLSLFLILSLFLSSCDKESDMQSTGISTNANDIAVLKSFLSEFSGEPLSKITFKNGNFTIAGDVRMSLNDARDHYKKSLTEKSSSGRTEQRQLAPMVNASVISNVTVYVAPGVPTDWAAAVNQAVANWNGADSKVHATLTSTAAGASISVSMNAGLPSGTIAVGAYPISTGNAVGSFVEINPAYNSLSASVKQANITHELGHTFGFRHTNSTIGELITDTPVSDPSSVMNSSVNNVNGFSFYDVIAIGIVYPNMPGTRRLLRYYASSVTDHFYTIHTNEMGPGGQGWVFEGGAGYIYPASTTGTVPFYRYYDAVTKDHFYTMNFGEVSWTYEGIAGYVSATQIPGTRPLYRYFNTVTKDHFYTVNHGEVGGAGWNDEGIACYVW